MVVLFNSSTLSAYHYKMGKLCVKATVLYKTTTNMLVKKAKEVST